MIKLLKYEFRKSLTTLLILLGVSALAEAYFLVSLHLDSMDHVAYAVILLTACATAASIFVFVRGLTTYTAELKSKSAYLVFMTPNSCLKIMASKYVYTFVNGLLVGAISVALLVTDWTLLMQKVGEWDAMLEMMEMLLRQFGVYMDQIALFAVAVLISAALSLLSFFAIAYLAVTISHTLLRDRKGRGLAALVVFIALTWLVSWVNNLFPSPTIDLVLIGERATAVEQTVKEMSDLIPRLLPSACVSLACILLSLFGCAWMLERKVSL